jgi:hypothetical protein
MNMVILLRTFKTYWLLMMSVALAFFAMSRWLIDRNYHPIELYYSVTFFICIFNLVACFRNIRSQINLGRIGIFAVILWPILLMLGNIEPPKSNTASEISWASFFILGALAIPVAQIGELLVHFALVSFGFASTHDLSKVMSISQYFAFEATRYVIWICIQWFWFVPLVMRWLRRRFSSKRGLDEVKDTSR